MKFRLGAEQYTYKTVERRISTASVALGLARTSMPGRQHHLTNLKRFTRYSVVVQAFNALGPGPMTQEVVASTLEDGKRPWKKPCWSIHFRQASRIPQSMFLLQRKYKLEHKSNVSVNVNASFTFRCLNFLLETLFMLLLLSPYIRFMLRFIFLPGKHLAGMKNNF